MPEPTPHPTQLAAGAALAALERYRLHAMRLGADWRDMDLYQRVAGDIDEVRHACHGLPALSGPWVALLIAHAELMNELWRAGSEPPASGEPRRRELLAQALARADAVRGACMQLLGVPGSGAN